MFRFLLTPRVYRLGPVNAIITAVSPSPHTPPPFFAPSELHARLGDKFHLHLEWGYFCIDKRVHFVNLSALLMALSCWLVLIDYPRILLVFPRRRLT